MGDIEKTVVDEEKIDKRNFIIPEIPQASSYGSRRAILSYIENLSYSIENDDLNLNRKMINFSFDLRKGCYATSFLREVMKSKDIKSY
jgi:tRNA pseudouridine13 synthase